MTSDRLQRRLERLLEEADEAVVALDWQRVRDRAQAALAIDPDNNEAHSYLTVAERGAGRSNRTKGASSPAEPVHEAPSSSVRPPTSFAAGRYAVKRFLGEGGKKKVYLAHDTLLDRDVAFALIKTEGLDETGRDRIRREAQAMGRLGAHPHIVSVFDLGTEPPLGEGWGEGTPFIVTELMGGGDVEGLIEKAPEHRPSLDRSLEIGIQVCRGLEFAHSHGIVHRDLKPGNVWLTADGTAKLGDFGLAVALDRSRLTQAGMMVGTVSYMPPEQAMGGEVTPRSDLYSLGAMLYEMVTGRPPFVGDESVAIITQHLNASPVAPSWHNPSIPPALETLVLRLLEKDPAKRPGSASEVREALGAIAQVARYPSLPASLPQGERGDGGDGATAPDNPMYRRTFVGREAELRQLQEAYDSALSGQGSLVMIVGEPGIGKTSLTEQLATYAAIRGGRALVGHCYEEGSLSLPYLPFVEAMRSYVLEREPDGLKSDLGSGAGDVARIVSEVRDRVHVELRPAGDPEEERWRLLQAVCGFLRNASTVQPLLLILEDLHDADRGTLDLLVHLAHNLAGARLLITGTYRDVEVDRTHPLSGTMAELRRGGNFLRVPLRGLTAEEVQRMMASASQQDIRWPFAELVHRQTEGNPLFVQEVLRYLVEEGLVERREGTLQRVGDETLAGRIPEGLRDVIGKRLSRLSDKANQVLSVAAVVGRDFRLDVLQQVLGMPEEELYAALEEASGAAVVESASGRQAVGTVGFRFMHAFFRQTLYEEIFVPRRIRFHQQVGRALEAAYGRRLEEHAAELAEHFAQSTEREDLEKALHYCELAASRAMSVYAYGEAVRHLGQALDVQEVLDPDEKAKRCDLLLALAEALLPVEPARVFETVAPQALALAETLEDSGRASRTCNLAIVALVRYGRVAMWGTPVLQQWAQRADRYAATGTADRAHANVFLGTTQLQQGRVAAGRELLRQALNLGRELDDAATVLGAAQTLLNWVRPVDADEQWRLAEEVAAGPRDRVSGSQQGSVLWNCGFTFLNWGERARADALWREVAEFEARTRDPSQGSWVREIWLATLAGELEAAVALGPRLLARAMDAGTPVAGLRLVHSATFRPLLYLGRGPEVLAAPPEALLGGLGRAGMVALCRPHLGHDAEASKALNQFLTGLRTDPGVDDALTFDLTSWLETAVILEDREAAEVLTTHLGPVAALAASTSQIVPTCIARHLGAAAALLGDRAASHRYYEQALELAGRMDHRPEIALTHLGIAELLLESADDIQRVAAIDHLDFAIGEFREMKMQPSLERTLRHKEVLKA